MDIDNNNLPDFLDFERVPQLHFANAKSEADYGEGDESVALQAFTAMVEKNVSVPSIAHAGLDQDCQYFLG